MYMPAIGQLFQSAISHLLQCMLALLKSRSLRATKTTSFKLAKFMLKMVSYPNPNLIANGLSVNRLTFVTFSFVEI